MSFFLPLHVQNLTHAPNKFLTDHSTKPTNQWFVPLVRRLVCLLVGRAVRGLARRETHASEGYRQMLAAF